MYMINHWPKDKIESCPSGGVQTIKMIIYQTCLLLYWIIWRFLNLHFSRILLFSQKRTKWKMVRHITHHTYFAGWINYCSHGTIIIIIIILNFCIESKGGFTNYILMVIPYYIQYLKQARLTKFDTSTSHDNAFWFRANCASCRDNLVGTSHIIFKVVLLYTWKLWCQTCKSAYMRPCWVCFELGWICLEQVGRHFNLITF